MGGAAAYNFIEWVAARYGIAPERQTYSYLAEVIAVDRSAELATELRQVNINIIIIIGVIIIIVINIIVTTLPPHSNHYLSLVVSRHSRNQITRRHSAAIVALHFCQITHAQSVRFRFLLLNTVQLTVCFSCYVLCVAMCAIDAASQAISSNFVRPTAIQSLTSHRNRTFVLCASNQVSGAACGCAYNTAHDSRLPQAISQTIVR